MSYAEDFFKALMENRVSIVTEGEHYTQADGPMTKHHRDSREYKIVVEKTADEKREDNLMTIRGQYHDMKNLTNVDFYLKWGIEKSDIPADIIADLEWYRKNYDVKGY